MFSFIYSNVFPPTCSLCDLPSTTGVDLCIACLRSLPDNYSSCATCALPISTLYDKKLSTGNEKLTLCGKCLRNKPPIEEAVIPFLYEPPVDFMIKRLKFSADTKYSRVMGELLAQAVLKSHRVWPDVLIPVPLHHERLLDRGYNQAFQIANIVSHRLAIPIDQHSIQRVDKQSSQVKLGARERDKNMRRAFTAVDDVAARKIAIVDDVYTTGATAQALARTLIKAGALSVSVWAFARTP